MEINEAIKKLKSKMDGSVDTSYEWCEAVRLAISALEKQIPSKPVPESEFCYGNGICPRCGAYFLDKLTDYCGNCGQALDWSDEE